MNIFKKLFQFSVGLNSAKYFVWGCFLVVIRSCFGKLDRNIVNQYLDKNAKKILKKIKSDYKIVYAENFKLLDNVPRIYISNHLSLYDTPLIYATINDTIRMVAKKELAKIPLIGRAIIECETALVDRNNPGCNQDFYLDAKRKLLDGIALWVFAEGTRSRTGDLLPFRLGGFRLAAEAGAQIIPVGIIGTNKILPTKKLIPNLNQSIEIHLGSPIFAGDCKTQESIQGLADEVRQIIQKLIRKFDTAK